MLNFDSQGDPSQRADVASRLQLFTYATCLGHEESLIMVYDDCRGGGFSRVSVSLEDPEGLIADLDRALEIVPVH